MLFRDDGVVVGLVSGGCLEADLAERARAVLAGGAAHTVVYDLRSPDDLVWGLGLGCGGEIRVLLEHLAPASPVDRALRAVAAARRERRSSAIATVFEVGGETDVRAGDRLWLIDGAGPEGTLAERELTSPLARALRAAIAGARTSVIDLETAHGSVGVLVEHVPTPIRLVVCGAGTDAMPVVRIAAGLGWHVTVLDHRPARARAELFPEAREVRCVDFAGAVDVDVDARTAVVLMTHHALHDRRLLARFLDSAAPYVGALGPRRRTDILLREIGSAPAARATLYAPVGLDIGSETPEEIALAVVAEVHAVLASRAGGSLRESRAPLHADVPAET
jgi:xanthine/CO dehydrogenase XdhC/CoxF family maturation factor